MTELDEIGLVLGANGGQSRPGGEGVPPSPDFLEIPKGGWGPRLEMPEHHPDNAQQATLTIEAGTYGGWCLRVDAPVGWSNQKRGAYAKEMEEAGWRSITAAEHTMMNLTREDCNRYLPASKPRIEAVPQGWEPPRFGGPRLSEDRGE